MIECSGKVIHFLLFSSPRITKKMTTQQNLQRFQYSILFMFFFSFFLSFSYFESFLCNTTMLHTMQKMNTTINYIMLY